MTDKANLYIYKVDNGTTKLNKIKKIKLKKFLKHLNNGLFTKQFYLNRKDAEQEVITTKSLEKIADKHDTRF